MELIGRIDRVDKAKDDHGVYLRIIDYKSSAKELNLSEVYYGITLQMLTYLDLIVHHSFDLNWGRGDACRSALFSCA